MVKKYVLPDLPYKYNALEPHISEEIMKLHHDKHHLAYVNGANTALEKLEMGRKSGFQGVDVRAVERDLSFNLSGHILHEIFWPNMSPTGGGKPGGALADRIASDFGGLDSFKAHFGNAAKTVEGIGWAMLTYDATIDQLLIIQAEKHNNQAGQGTAPIFVLDVWEHAYYLQYKNDRASYVDAWWNVANWDFAENKFNKVKV